MVARGHPEESECVVKTQDGGKRQFLLRSVLCRGFALRSNVCRSKVATALRVRLCARCIELVSRFLSFLLCFIGSGFRDTLRVHISASLEGGTASKDWNRKDRGSAVCLRATIRACGVSPTLYDASITSPLYFFILAGNPPHSRALQCRTPRNTCDLLPDAWKSLWKRL